MTTPPPPPPPPSVGVQQISPEGWSPTFYEHNVEFVELIQAIEEQGGLEGYIKFLNHRRPAEEPKPTIMEFSQSTNITINISFTTKLIIAKAQTEDGHRTGWVGPSPVPIPIPIPPRKVTGILVFNSWETLMSAPNIFTVNLADKVVPLQIGGQTVGQIIVGNIGQTPDGIPATWEISGKIVWKK